MIVYLAIEYDSGEYWEKIGVYASKEAAKRAMRATYNLAFNSVGYEIDLNAPMTEHLDRTFKAGHKFYVNHTEYRFMDVGQSVAFRPTTGLEPFDEGDIIWFGGHREYYWRGTIAQIVSIDWDDQSIIVVIREQRGTP
jgi:hypothetical protein